MSQCKELAPVNEFGMCGCELKGVFLCLAGRIAVLWMSGGREGGHRSSYRPSDGGSLPLEPDWARLM